MERTERSERRGQAVWLVGLPCILILLVVVTVGWACFRPLEVHFGSYYLVFGRPGDVHVCLALRPARGDQITANGRSFSVPDREGLLLAWMRD